MNQQLSTIFSYNRAEEFPDDLWQKFVLPLEYNNYNLLTYKKATRIVGGRGTGKTTFLKYHCYPTQLSQKRFNVNDSDINQIGIYWKPDTHFAQLLNQNYLGENWASAFNTYVGISLIMEFVRFSNVFLESNYDDVHVKKRLAEFQVPKAICDELLCEPGTLLVDLYDHCDSLLYKFSNWVHRPRHEMPITLDGKASLQFIINNLHRQNLLTNSGFHIFIDEFENLREEQQIIINTWMKHGKIPLLFSTAYKKYAAVSNLTTGNETFHPTDDYRLVNIVEDVYAKIENSFKVLASEIIATKIQEYLGNKDVIDPLAISDQSQILSRQNKSYQDTILHFSETIFPEMTYKDICQEICKDDKLSNRLEMNIALALKEKSSSIPPNNFIDINFPEASVVNSVLLFRNPTVPADLLKTFSDYKLQPSQYKAYKELISNNVVGAILYLYTSFPQRICPIYAGFDKFCLMAKNNLRHLFELCHYSFIELENSQEYNPLNNQLPIVPIELQAKAARVCSKAVLEKIAELGPYGQDLQKIASRLGKIFYLRQKIKAQSEPEMVHFGVDTFAVQTLGSEVETLIHEAKLWNVLQEYDATKGKSLDIASKEYMLTPMVSPYFRISIRKIKKLELSIDDLNTIFVENDNKFDEYYDKLIKKWKIEDEPKKIQQTLFEDLF